MWSCMWSNKRINSYYRARARLHTERSAACVANGARASAMVSVSSSKSVSRSGAARRDTDARAPDALSAKAAGPSIFGSKS